MKTPALFVKFYFKIYVYAAECFKKILTLQFYMRMWKIKVLAKNLQQKEYFLKVKQGITIFL
jgi:hypothetical protein